MPVGDYLGGFAYFVPTIACALAGAWLLLTRRYGHLNGAPRIVAYGMLATLGVIAIHLVPAALAVLSRPTVLASAALWLAAAALVPAVARGPEPAAEPNPESSTIARTLSWLALGVLALFALAVARDQLFLAPLADDTLNFHLPGVASWIQSGSIWQIDAFLPDVAPGHYPNTGDLLLLAAVLPWSNDFLSHFAMYPAYVLTGVTTYALAVELRAPRAAAIAAACLVLSMPAVLVPALIGSFPDALMLFGFAAGILFLLRHHRTAITAELVLAGLSLGVAFGTKWYGVSAVAIVLAAWFVAGIVAGRGRGLVIRQALAVVGLVALAGGVWMLRNWVESGNPVFPVRVAPFGIEIFDAPPDLVREAGGFTLAGYLDQPRIWLDSIVPQLRDVLAAAGAFVLASLALTAYLLGSRARRNSPGRSLAFLGLIVAALLIVVYLITPYTAGGPPGNPYLAASDSRYVVPALLVGAVLAAWCAGRLRRGPEVLAGLALLAVIDGVVQASDSDISLATIGANHWLAAALVAAIAALCVWRVGRRWVGLGRRARRSAVALGLGALLLVGLAGGYEMQKRFNAIRYVSHDETIDYVLAAGAGTRVGLAGLWDAGIAPVLPAFGPRLRNRVAYVGTDDEGFIRRFTDRDRFVAALRRGGFELLIVGHGIPRQRNLREERWAKAAGWEPVAVSDRLTLLRAPERGRDSERAAGDREDVVAEEEAERT